DRIFEKVYNVKRLHPGLLRTRERINSFGNSVNALTHDSSTLGGNSGSAVLDVKTGQIVGLHFAGIYLKSNYAVPAWELARDTQVVNAGVNFAGKVPATQEWAAVWKSTEPAGNQEVSAPPPSPTGEPRPPENPAVKIEQSPAPASTTISPTIVANGGVTWTIPLQVTVSLGQIQQMLVAATTASAAEVEGVQPKIVGDLTKRRGFDPQFLKLANGNPILPPELTKAGKAVAAPLLSDGSIELKYHHFSVVMHKTRRLAIYTAANVDWREENRLVNGKKPTRKELTELDDNDREEWRTDPRILEKHQLPDIFYTNDRSSFDKGHLVRRDDVCYGTSFEDMQKANGDTYYTTNCSPQTAFAGPVLADDDPVFRGRDRDGVARVQIPRKFWKIIVAKGDHGPEAFGFVLEQDLSQTDLEMAVPKAWRKYMKPISEIEKLLNKLAKLTHLKPIDQFGSPQADAIARKVNS
ncbi:MAG: DNA/RNA non-specific endonuclease, partial [Planctomycetota bacterium]|nr:DNA/RNA non-specific endonuclease [Planctomycetota bacterium]